MYAVQMKKTIKTFGNFKANDQIDLFVKKGEIHTILGENGSGKSTLMNCLIGIYKIDGGNIEINNKKVLIDSPLKAFKLKIGMVHQHFKLVNSFTILENIILGSEPTKNGLLNYSNERQKIEELIKKYSFDLDLNTKISDLTVSQEQKVEIIKLLYKDLDILIFDEPTAVLSPQETTDFLKMIKFLKSEGKTIILITHKLEEIKIVSDSCTIIRRGKFIKRVQVDNVTEQELATFMVGQDVELSINKMEGIAKNKALELRNISFINKKKIKKLKNVNFCAYRGRILGIAGIDNNGQRELVDVITRYSDFSKGNLIYFDEFGKQIELKKKNTKEVNDGIISYIPEDRLKEGIIGEFDLAQNSILINFFKDKFGKYGMLNKKNIEKYGQNIIDYYDVRSSRGISNKAEELSGGNQQKLIVGRQIEIDSQIILAFQPTRGVDVGAINFIHKKLIAERDKGKAVILISYELDEVLELSDDIAVIHNGEITEVRKASEMTREEIGLKMGGSNVN